ncbi:RNA polymerase II transcription elongation factor-domain-containing protein [Xylariaceae sp. FL0255]|nr:RNA polymerase II transcription elongation factor-domain-containing protein [Xylariaceae sp. FL0255]
MASLAAGIVDPTKAGKYRVVLSDDLLGKDPKQVYTGVRYNHRPNLSSSSAPHQARIKQSDSSNYDLSFQDDGGRYAYRGTRGQEDNQYVLIFDPDRDVFVLHRLDSMFNMNLTRTPSNNDAASLRQEHKQLDAHRPPKTQKTATSKAKKPQAKETRPQKANPPKPASKPAPQKAQDDSDDESSDDDLLTIEDPGGAALTSHRDFSPGFIDKPRRFSEFVQQQNEEEDEDADADPQELLDTMDLDEHRAEAVDDADGEDEEEEEEEDDDDPIEHFKLPSPMNRQMMGSINAAAGPKDQDDEEEMEDVEEEEAPTNQDEADMALEAALMAEFDDQESDVSEEE